MGLKDRIRVRLLKKVVNDPVLYDVITAIRGCDSTNSALKYLFTSRIRYLAGLDPSNVNVDVRVNEEIKLRMIYKAVDTVSEVDAHCLSHIECAINALRKLKLMDEKEAYMLTAIARTLILIAIGEEDRDTVRKMIDKLAKEYEELIKP